MAKKRKTKRKTKPSPKLDSIGVRITKLKSDAAGKGYWSTVRALDAAEKAYATESTERFRFIPPPIGKLSGRQQGKVLMAMRSRRMKR